MFDPLVTARYTANLVTDIESEGIVLSFETDFVEFKALCARLPGKRPALPLFDPTATEVDSRNSFWIRGELDGEIVHVQALRRISLGEMPLADHLSRYRHLYRPHIDEIDISRSEFHHSKLAKRVVGDTVYHGDIWLDHSVRGSQLSKALPPLACALAYSVWQPDFMFGFGDDPIPEKGILTQYGYYSLDPAGIFWRDSEGNLVRNFWLAVAERDHILTRINLLGIQARARKAAPAEPAPLATLRKAG